MQQYKNKGLTFWKKGEKCQVDKGICGIDTGKFIGTTGYSAFGFIGLYKSDKDGEEHIWDESVHKVTKVKD
jgi:hypothetical protein